MPIGNKGKDNPNIVVFIFRASEWNKNIANQPLVKASVPGAPESLEAIIVKNATIHILRRLHSIEQSPVSSDSPNHYEFKPKEDKLKEGSQSNLFQIEGFPNVLVVWV